jgi:hypothetical protein
VPETTAVSTLVHAMRLLATTAEKMAFFIVYSLPSERLGSWPAG